MGKSFSKYENMEMLVTQALIFSSWKEILGKRESQIFCVIYHSEKGHCTAVYGV